MYRSALEDGADDGEEGGNENGVLSRHAVSELTCGETTKGLSSVVDGYNSAGVRGVDHGRSVHDTFEAVMTEGGCDDACRGVVSANGGIVLLRWCCTRVEAIDEATLSGDEGHGQYQPVHSDQIREVWGKSGETRGRAEGYVYFKCLRLQGRTQSWEHCSRTV